MKSAILAVMLSIGPSVVMADGPSNNYAVITGVHPVYANRNVEKTETHCYNVEIPVYGRTQGGSDGDVLAGALIGGAIGNQFGSGSGKDAMTVLGAIVGANRGANASREVIVGYRLKEMCDEVVRFVNEPVITHYRITYTYNGIEYHQETSYQYTLGQRVPVQPILK